MPQKDRQDFFFNLQMVSTSSFCQELFFIHSAGPTERPDCRSCIFPAGFCVGSRIWTLLLGAASLSCSNGLPAGMKSSSARGQVDMRHHSPGMTLPSQPVANLTATLGEKRDWKAAIQCWGHFSDEIKSHHSVHSLSTCLLTVIHTRLQWTKGMHHQGA